MSVPSTAEALGPPLVFGHYVIERVLGTGGMGTVYVATHVELKKRVALKTLLPAYAAHPEARARFLREGELAARLRHPHVVDVTDLGLQDGVPYLVMEYLEGEDLATTLEREVQIFPDVLADLLVPVVGALACAHDQGIIHRDLKPQNIFLVPTRAGPPIAKVLDFGISKVLHDPEAAHLTGSLSLLGTPSYMSPEQVRSGKDVDARSDQYSMGVILYQCATGRLPFTGETVFEVMTAVASGICPRPRDVCAGLPEEFEALVVRAMSPAPGDRYPSTRAFGKALMAFASERVRLNWTEEFQADELPRAGSRARSISLSELRPSTAPSLRVAALLDTQAPGTGPQAQVGPGLDRPPSSPGREPGPPALVLEVPAPRLHATSPTRPGTHRPPGFKARLGVAALGITLVLTLLGFVVLRSLHGDAEAPTPSSPQVAEAQVDPKPAAVSPSPPPAPPAPPARRTFHAELDVQPASAEIELDGTVVGIGTFATELARDGATHSLVIRSDGFETQTLSFQDAPPPPLVALTRAPRHHRSQSKRGAIGSGELAIVTLLHGEPAWADVTIDGVSAARQTPLTAHLPFGRHQVALSRPGLKPVRVEVEVQRGALAKVRAELAP